MHSFAQQAQKHGRFGDTLVAHLSKSEANLLKKAGGSGTVNPQTGLLEFYKGTLGGRGIQLFNAEEEKKELNKPSVADAFQNLVKAQEEGKKNLDSDKNGKASQQALAIAEILMGSRNVYDDKEAMYIPMFFGKGKNPDPFSPRTSRELNDLYYKIGGGFWKNMLRGDGGGDDDPDMQARDLRRFMKKIRNHDKTDLNLAFHELGLELPKSDGKKGIQSSSWYSWDTVDGKPVSLAQTYGKKVLEGLYNIGDQTSTTMGNVKGPQHAGTFDGSWSDAFTQIVTGLMQVAPLISPTAALTTFGLAGTNAIRNPYMSFSDALGEALGFGPPHGFRYADVSLDDGGEDNEEDGPFGGMGAGGGGE